MNVFTTPADITITAHKRIAPYLAQEVQQLGYTVLEEFVTGVKLRGTVQDCIRLNLQLRCASQVLYSLHRFEAHHPDEVYRQVNKMPWQEILPEPCHFSVTSNVSTPSINNSMFANLRVKDGIVDCLRQQRGVRPTSGAELTGVVVHLFWKQNQAEIFLDTSGDSLARHGYRKIPGLAPMLEGLAVAAIFATGWQGRSAFVNPMCGAGTLAIEAALMASNRRPGLFRSQYAFMHLVGYDAAVYEAEKASLLAQIDEPSGAMPAIIASDHSSFAVENAIKNAEAAGVRHLISFQVCDFAKTELPPAPGVVMLNPEYGERLGDEVALGTVYASIGDFFKQACGGFMGYVFTGNLELAKKIGLRAKRRIEFYNSTIDCRLLEYELYAGSRRAPKPEA